MALDPDLVRVDLLRCKRLIYVSYPEGSRERADFLYAAKLSELNYLSKLVPPEIVNMVFDEYARLRKDELKNIGLTLWIGLLVLMLMFNMHKLYPLVWVWKFWYASIAGVLLETIRHIWHMVLNWKKVQPFKLEYTELGQKIKKLTDELKGLVQ
jgi:hypothetical protein